MFCKCSAHVHAFPDHMPRSDSSSPCDHAGPGRSRTRFAAFCGRWTLPWTSPQPPANPVTSRTPVRSLCRGPPARTPPLRRPSASFSQPPPPKTLPLCAVLPHWHPPAASCPGGTQTDAHRIRAWTALRTEQTSAPRLPRARRHPVRGPETGMRATARPTLGEPGQVRLQRARGGKRRMTVSRRPRPAALPPAAAPQ